MAYLVDNNLTFLNSASTSISLNMPAHQADDVLVLFVTQDANTAITLVTTGWTVISTSVTAGGGLVSAAWYKKAESGSESIVLTTTDGWCATVYSIRDVDTTTPLDASSFTGNSTAKSEFSHTSITTTTADCFILYCVGVDGIAVATHSDPGTMFIHSFDNQGTTATTSACAAGAWYIQRTVGPTPVATWTASLAGATTMMTLAFRNRSGGRIPPYIDDVISPGSKLTPGHHFSALNGISFAAALPVSNIGPNGAGKATVFDAAAATADYGINPYSAALVTTPPTTAATSVAGFAVNFSGGRNLSDGFVMGSIIAANPKMANYTHGNVEQGGSYIAFVDTASNYRSYQVLASNSQPNTEGRAVFSIKPSQTATAYGTSGSMNAAMVTGIMLLTNCPKATVSLYLSELHNVGTQVVAGGDAMNPVDSEGVAQIGKSFRIGVIQKFGAAGLLSYVPIQVGGGDRVNFNVNAGAMQFPRKSNIIARELNFHATEKDIGISYAGSSGDVIRHTNSVIASASEYYWEINSAATSAAIWDFNGLTIAGAFATMRNVTTFEGMTFAGCTYINASGCSLNGCVISNVPTGSDTLTLNESSSISACSVSVTTLATGSYLCSTATPNVFANNTFSGSSTAGHAMRITATGTYAFVGNVFNGFGASGTPSAAIYNNSSGAVILNVSNGGSTPTYRDSPGSSTSVVNSVVLTLATLVSGSDIVILNAGTETTRVDVNTNPGDSYNYVYSYLPSDKVDIGVFITGYVPYFVRNLTLGATNGTLPIAQVSDRNFSNPA